MTLAHKSTLSIIIPVLNDSENLKTCLATLARSEQVEIIVCDGGSSDDTMETARKFPVTRVTSPPGRATQMNAAARCARGDTLLFLHADTRLPSTACKDIIKAVDAGYSMGCFIRKFDRDSWLLSITSRVAGWRARKTFLAFGDQAIFIKRDLFTRLGGYRELSRFEDLDLAVRARRHGRWSILPGPIITDARRFGRHPLPRIIRDALLTLAWLTGVIDQ